MYVRVHGLRDNYISVYTDNTTHTAHSHGNRATLIYVHTAIPTNLPVVSTSLPMSQPSKIFEIFPSFLYMRYAAITQTGCCEWVSVLYELCGIECKVL